MLTGERVVHWPSRLDQMSDGLSNTALLSERLVASPGGRGRNPIVVDSPPEYLALGCAQAQVDGRALPDGDLYAGTAWLKGASRHSEYQHYLPPNSRLRDCEAGGWVGMALMTARSGHTGGVSVAYLDGHVAFTSDSVSLDVWRGEGTPASGETTDNH